MRLLCTSASETCVFSGLRRWAWATLGTNACAVSSPPPTTVPPHPHTYPPVSPSPHCTRHLPAPPTFRTTACATLSSTSPTARAPPHPHTYTGPLLSHRAARACPPRQLSGPRRAPL
eukprot:365654-Chlamydomonas_euryale.AAC.4